MEDRTSFAIDGLRSWNLVSIVPFLATIRSTLTKSVSQHDTFDFHHFDFWPFQFRSDIWINQYSSSSFHFHWLIYLFLFFFWIESTAGPYESRHEGKRVDIIYATFTTPSNALSGSAVCAFRLHDVEKVFDGAFKEQAALNYNWLPVPAHKVCPPSIFFVLSFFQAIFSNHTFPTEPTTTKLFIYKKRKQFWKENTRKNM